MFGRLLFIDIRKAAESFRAGGVPLHKTAGRGRLLNCEAAPGRVGTAGELHMNYTYMVRCADGTLYTGWTNCLGKRLKAHNEGADGAKYTKTKRPVSLVYYEGFATKEEAMRREYQIKQLTKKQKLGLLEF